MAHYDGQSWSELAPLYPAPCQVDCSDEDCITPNCTLVAQASDDVWLAGARWLWHWDGLSWQQSEPPYAVDAGEVQVFRVVEHELWLTVWRTYPRVMTTLFRREGDGWVEVAPGLPRPFATSLRPGARSWCPTCAKVVRRPRRGSCRCTRR